MTRTMYDSTNMPAIPANAEIVAGYPHAFPTDYARFPRALQVRIDQHGNHPDDCHVADVENGAIPVQSAPEWVDQWHRLHPNGLAAVNGHFDRPTIYANLSTWNSSLRGLLAGLLYDAWIALWDSPPTVLPASSLHQYASPSSSPPSGGDYDVSVVYDPAWGVAGSPTPPPPPDWQVRMMRSLPTVRQGSTGPDVRSVQGLCMARGTPALVIDGIFGAKTDAAVRLVQVNARLPVDGVVGPSTWQALMAV